MSTAAHRAYKNRKAAEMRLRRGREYLDYQRDYKRRQRAIERERLGLPATAADLLPTP